MITVGGGFAGIGSGGSWAHTTLPASNSLLVCFIGMRLHSSAMSITRVDVDGVPMVVKHVTGDGVARATQVWTLTGVLPGEHVITITTGGTDRHYCANTFQISDAYDAPVCAQTYSSTGGGTVNLAATQGDTMVCALMQVGTITVATPETGGTVLVPPLATVDGVPSDENCSIAVACQEGVAAGLVSSSFTTDLVSDSIVVAMDFVKYTIESTGTAVLGMTAVVTNFYQTSAPVSATLGDRLTVLEAKLKDLESRTERSRRGTWGR